MLVKFFCVIFPNSGNAPTFTNLPNTLTLTDDRAANTLLFTVSVNDVDPQDTPTLVGLTTIIDFTFNAANGLLFPY